MQNTVPAMLAQIFASVLHLVLCYVFIFRFGMDVRGLGLAMSLTNFFKITFICTYSFCSRTIRRALVRPTFKDVFSGWKEYLKLAVPAMLILCSEWWAYEIIAALSGVLGTTEMASMTIVITAYGIFFEIPVGTAEASCALIGYNIGAGNVDLARRYFKVTVIVACCEAVVISVLILFGSHVVAEFYSTNEDVQDMASTVLKVSSLCFLFDCV